MNKLFVATAFISGIVLTGCASYDLRAPKYSAEGHLLGTIVKNDDGSKPNSNGYFDEYGSSFHDKNNQPLAEDYLRTGVLLTRTNCYQALDSLSSENNNNRFEKGQFGILALLASGIMGVDGSDAKKFTRLALGGAAVNSTFDLYQNHYLLGPDGDAITKMVKKAMDVMHVEITKVPPSGFLDAFAKLQNYSQLCTNASIRRLVREAIVKADFVVEAPLIEEKTRVIKDAIATEYGRLSLSELTLYSLWVVLFKDPINKSLVTKLTSNLSAENLSYANVRSSDFLNKSRKVKEYLWQLPKMRAYFEDKYKNYTIEQSSFSIEYNSSVAAIEKVGGDFDEKRDWENKNIKVNDIFFNVDDKFINATDLNLLIINRNFGSDFVGIPAPAVNYTPSILVVD